MARAGWEMAENDWDYPDVGPHKKPRRGYRLPLGEKSPLHSSSDREPAHGWSATLKLSEPPKISDRPQMLKYLYITLEVQKITRCLQSAGTRGGLIHSLIRNPEANRTRYVGFRLASSKSTSKLCMIPHGENRIS